MMSKPKILAYVLQTRRVLVECGTDTEWMSFDDLLEQSSAWDDVCIDFIRRDKEARHAAETSEVSP